MLSSRTSPVIPSTPVTPVTPVTPSAPGAASTSRVRSGGLAGLGGRGAAPGAPPAGGLVAVVGACGGAGASSVAAAVAVAGRAAGSRLVDLAGRGGGLDVLLGIEASAGARWPDLAYARGDVDPEALVASLPRWREVPVLSADRWRPEVPHAVVPDVVRTLLARSPHVVVDLDPGAAGGVTGTGPPDARARWDETAARRDVFGGGDAGVAWERADVVLVVPLTVPGLAGALATSARLADQGVGLLGRRVVVVRGRQRGPVTGADVAAALESPVVARVVWRAAGARAVERGDGPPVGRGTSLRRAGEAVLSALGRPRHGGDR